MLLASERCACCYQLANTTGGCLQCMSSQLFCGLCHARVACGCGRTFKCSCPNTTQPAEELRFELQWDVFGTFDSAFRVQASTTRIFSSRPGDLKRAGISAPEGTYPAFRLARFPIPVGEG